VHEKILPAVVIGCLKKIFPPGFMQLRWCDAFSFNPLPGTAVVTQNGDRVY